MPSSSTMPSSDGISSEASIKPFSGRKAFRTWSIGINGGALYPAVAFGGSNDFTNSEITLGYGVNLKYQAAHWLAMQLDFLRGKLKGNQDNNLTDGSVAFPNFRNVKSFETEIHAAISLSGVFTLGNINWLSARSKVIPYVSIGGGIAWYEPTIVYVPLTLLLQCPHLQQCLHQTVYLQKLL
jgi:OOP family OmpA-OmpF porin